MKTGRIRAIPHGPRRWLIPRSEVERRGAVTVQQAADYLGISRQALHRAIKAGRLPTIPDSRPMRVLWWDVAAYKVAPGRIARKRPHGGN